MHVLKIPEARQVKIAALTTSSVPQEFLLTLLIKPEVKGRIPIFGVIQTFQRKTGVLPKHVGAVWDLSYFPGQDSSPRHKPRRQAQWPSSQVVPPEILGVNFGGLLPTYCTV